MSQRSLFPDVEVFHDETDQGGLDRYYTDPRLAQAAVRDVVESTRIPEAPVVIEPSVGGGAWVRAVREVRPHAFVIGVDKDADAAGLRLCDEAHPVDWTTFATRAVVERWAEAEFVWVVGNPPFSKAHDHAPLCWQIGTITTLLLRATWFDSLKVRPTLDAAPPTRRVVLPNPRASYTGQGHDPVPALITTWDRRHTGPAAFSILPWRGAKR